MFIQEFGLEMASRVYDEEIVKAVVGKLSDTDDVVYDWALHIIRKIMIETKEYDSLIKAEITKLLQEATSSSTRYDKILAEFVDILEKSERRLLTERIFQALARHESDEPLQSATILFEKMMRGEVFDISQDKEFENITKKLLQEFPHPREGEHYFAVSPQARIWGIEMANKVRNSITIRKMVRRLFDMDNGVYEKAKSTIIQILDEDPPKKEFIIDEIKKMFGSNIGDHVPEGRQSLIVLDLIEHFDAEEREFFQKSVFDLILDVDDSLNPSELAEKTYKTFFDQGGIIKPRTDLYRQTALRLLEQLPQIVNGHIDVPVHNKLGCGELIWPQKSLMKKW